MKEFKKLNFDCLEVRQCRLCSQGIHTEAMADKLQAHCGRSSLCLSLISALYFSCIFSSFIRVLELASGYRLAVTGWSQLCQSLLERIKIFQKLTVLLSLKLTPSLIELPVTITGHSSKAVQSVGHGRWAFCLLLSLPWSYIA